MTELMRDHAVRDNRTPYMQGRADQRRGDIAVALVCAVVAVLFILFVER